MPERATPRPRNRLPTVRLSSSFPAHSVSVSPPSPRLELSPAWSPGFFFARRAADLCSAIRARIATVALALLVAGCAIGPVETASRIDRLVDAAYAEWRDWGEQRVDVDAQGGLCARFDDGRCLAVDNGCGREMSSRYCALVNRYWPVVSDYRHPCDATDLCEARLPPGAQGRYSEPWSAAFISYLYRKAGFGWWQFSFSDTHADYVSAARDGVMRDFTLVPAPFAPRRGDLVCSGRGPDRELSPAQIALIAEQASGTGFTRMHCDLVVDVAPGAGLALAIGGNVEQSVSMREIALDARGMVDWASPPGPGWLLALRLRHAPEGGAATSRTARWGSRTP